jgi:hypothetical protein
VCKERYTFLASCTRRYKGNVEQPKMVFNSYGPGYVQGELFSFSSNLSTQSFIILFCFGVVSCSDLELQYVAFAWSPDGSPRPLIRLLTCYLNCVRHTDQKWAIKSHLWLHLAAYWPHLTYFKFWASVPRITRSVHVRWLNKADCIVRISASSLFYCFLIALSNIREAVQRALQMSRTVDTTTK